MEDVLPKLKRVPTSRYSSILAYQLAQVKACFLMMIPTATSIVDTTCHIGGDSLHFANSIYPDAHITAIDVDPVALDCMKTNVAAHSDPSRFTFVNEDCISYIFKERPKADFYYLDPPWGGPNYSNEKQLSLHIGDTPISTLINRILDEKLTTRVVLKVPRNFAYPTFKREIRGFASLHYIRKPQKSWTVAYGLILIVR
jgi:hypothetical protein